MAGVQILAIVFAFQASAVQADSCTSASAKYKLKADTFYAATTNLCGTSTANANGCGAVCCDVKTNICHSAKSTKTCPTATHYYDENKAGNPVTSTDFNTQCCTPKKKCDITCPAGYKDKTTKATEICAGATCSTTECCELDDTKCLHKGMSTSCGTGKVKDPSKYGTTATTFATDCCATAVKCAASVCTSAGLMLDSTKTNDCVGPTCTEPECCKADPAKCISVTCPATHVHDASKLGTAGTDAATCCVAKATCKAFKEGAVSSLAVQQQVPAMLVLLAVGGFVALIN